MASVTKKFDRYERLFYWTVHEDASPHFRTCTFHYIHYSINAPKYARELADLVNSGVPWLEALKQVP